MLFKTCLEDLQILLSQNRFSLKKLNAKSQTEVGERVAGIKNL